MQKPLTIAVDVRDLQVAQTGTRTYLEELCKEFKKMENDALRFYFFDTGVPVYTGSNKFLRYIEHLRYQLWKQLILPIKAFFKSCDIVFCTDNCVPLIRLGYKTIPVFHDAFCFESPETYGKLWLWLYMKTAVPAARRSRFIITPSEWSKNRIIHYTSIPAEKLIVVYEGPKQLNDPAPTPVDVLTKFSISSKKYLLHVGSMFKRKNIPALIEAFALVKKSNKELKLVLAGPVPPTLVHSGYHSILSAIDAHSLADDVIFTGYLSDQDLGSLYQNGLMYVFPSINEGFGLPVLESFKNDLPVLVADNSCLPEVGGNAVLLFDPFDARDIAAKIETVINNAGLRQNMINNGRERLKLFSWESTTLQLVEIFRKSV